MNKYVSLRSERQYIATQKPSQIQTLPERLQLSFRAHEMPREKHAGFILHLPIVSKSSSCFRDLAVQTPALPQTEIPKMKAATLPAQIVKPCKEMHKFTTTQWRSMMRTARFSSLDVAAEAAIKLTALCRQLPS